MSAGRPSSSIVITGLGLVTPLGIGASPSWERLCAGGRAGRWLTGDAPGGWEDRWRWQPDLPWWGAPVSGLNCDTVGRPASFALRAATEAIASAGPFPASGGPRWGCVIGSSKADLAQSWTERTGSPPLPAETACSPYEGLGLSPAAPATAVAAAWDCRGPVLSPVAACATGLVSLIRAAQLLERGECDIVLAGSSDASLTPNLLAAYRRLGVLAAPDDDPAGACKPFDRDRNGFVVGEGAAVIVMERAEHAADRGAQPRAIWGGGTLLNDPTTLLHGTPAGTVLTEVVQRLLARAALTPDDIDAVSLHGTGTRHNDAAEGRALARVLQHRGPCPAFSVKGSLGHLMGAAGAVESALSVLALEDQRVPPTANHRHPDPDGAALCLSSTAVPRRLRHLLKVSLGFGGHVAAVLLQHPRAGAA